MRLPFGSARHFSIHQCDTDYSGQKYCVEQAGTKWEARAMVCIRPATVDDLLAMQRCNLLCLPENYQLKVRAARQQHCCGSKPSYWPA